jgi:hypothetical protein
VKSIARCCQLPSNGWTGTVPMEMADCRPQAPSYGSGSRTGNTLHEFVELPIFCYT